MVHPRRTVESYRHWSMPSTYSEVFQEGNPVPGDFKTLKELWEWYEPLIKAEKDFFKRSTEKDKKSLGKTKFL